MKPFAFLLLAVLCFKNASGYGTGAPVEICDTMIPGHGAAPQTSSSPYKIILSENTTLKPGDEVIISLSSPGGTLPFRGFLLQVRKVGDSTPVGRWRTEDSEDMQTLDCADEDNSAITHTSDKEKRIVQAKWNAPSGDESADYQVYYTVVGTDHKVYWTAVRHPDLIKIRTGSGEEEDAEEARDQAETTTTAA